MAKWQYSEEDLERQAREAAEAEKRAQRDPRTVVAARFKDGKEPALEIRFRSGGMIKAPIASIPELKDAPADLVSKVKVNAFGRALDWDELDAHIGISAIMADCFGFDSLGEVARRGGRARSDDKARASRENGKKGGRPRKTM